MRSGESISAHAHSGLNQTDPAGLVQLLGAHRHAASGERQLAQHDDRGIAFAAAGRGRHCRVDDEPVAVLRQQALNSWRYVESGSVGPASSAPIAPITYRFRRWER
jgi:hypothetical protein